MTQTLEREFVDTTPDDNSQPAPAAPARHTRSGRGVRTWRNRLVVLVMVGGAAFGTVQLIHHQAAQSAQLAVSDVVLTAQPIGLNVTQTGLVTSVDVKAGDRVTAGQRVGTMDVTTTNTAGDPVVVRQDIDATSNGVVVTDPSAVGNTLLPGNSFLQMYDPAALDLLTTVPLTQLSEVRPGMTVVLTAPGVLGSVQASVERAVPRVGNDQTDVAKGNVQLVLTPRSEKAVANLLPGLRFHGYIDTRTAQGSRSQALYVGGSR